MPINEASTCTPNTTSLFRYTSYERFIRELKDGYLRLSDPSKWSDDIDKKAIKKFEALEGVTVRALCFTSRRENSLQWDFYNKINSQPKEKAIKIEFCRKNIYNIAQNNRFEIKNIKYETIENISKVQKFDRKNLLYTKRKAYESEKEERLIWIGQENETEKAIVEIGKLQILRIIVSPYVDDKCMKSMKLDIQNLLNVKILKSGLMTNRKWQKFISNHK